MSSWGARAWNNAGYWSEFFFFSSSPVLLLLPLGLKVVEATPRIIFLDPEGTQGSWWHPIPYLKAGLSWFGLGGGYLPLRSRVCWDWIQATVGFWAWQNLVRLRWVDTWEVEYTRVLHNFSPASSAKLWAFPANKKKLLKGVSFSSNFRFLLCVFFKMGQKHKWENSE